MKIAAKETMKSALLVHDLDRIKVIVQGMVTISHFIFKRCFTCNMMGKQSQLCGICSSITNTYANMHMEKL